MQNMSVPSSPSSAAVTVQKRRRNLTQPLCGLKQPPKVPHPFADMGTGVLRGILRVSGHPQSPP